MCLCIFKTCDCKCLWHIGRISTNESSHSCSNTSYCSNGTCGIWLPRWFSGKQFACQFRKTGLWSLGVRKIPWRRKWQPTPVLYRLGNPMDGGAWWATIHELTKRHDWVAEQAHTCGVSTCLHFNLSVNSYLVPMFHHYKLFSQLHAAHPPSPSAEHWVEVTVCPEEIFPILSTPLQKYHAQFLVLL